MKTIYTLINHVLGKPIQTCLKDGTTRTAELEEFSVIMAVGVLIKKLEKMTGRVESRKDLKPARLKDQLEECEYYVLSIMDSLRYLIAARTSDREALETIRFVLGRTLPGVNATRKQTD